MKTFILSDNSGYFIFGRNSDSNSPSICKYLFSITESAYCQEISSLTQFVKAQLMLSNSEFFFIGSKPTTSYDLHFYKITYGSSHADWSKKMLCASAWSIGSSETIVHTDNKKFYNYYMFGTSPNFYVGIVAFNLTNGDIIGSRYYSDIIWTAFTGSTIKDGEVLTTVKWGGVSFIMIFNTSTSTFLIYKFNGSSLNQISTDK